MEHHAKPEKPEELSPFERFREFARRIVAVPKAEIDEKMAEYRYKKTKERNDRVLPVGR